MRLLTLDSLAVTQDVWLACHSPWLWLSPFLLRNRVYFPSPTRLVWLSFRSVNSAQYHSSTHRRFFDGELSAGEKRIRKPELCEDVTHNLSKARLTILYYCQIVVFVVLTELCYQQSHSVWMPNKPCLCCWWWIGWRFLAISP